MYPKVKYRYCILLFRFQIVCLYKTQKFLPRFLQKANGCGRSPRIEVEKKQNTKGRGTKCRQKRKSKRKHVKNANHLQTGIFSCGLFTQRKIKKASIKDKLPNRPIYTRRKNSISRRGDLRVKSKMVYKGCKDMVYNL